MATKRTFLFLLGITFMCGTYATPLERGKTIFTTRCAACHNVNKVVLGPALSGVDKRHAIDWIIKFVRSSQTMVKAGDKVAVAVYEKFNKVAMPDHSDLSEEDIKGVVAFINAETLSVSATSAPFAKPGKKRPDHTPLSSDDYIFISLYLFAVAALVRALVYVVQVKSYTRELAEVTTY